MEYRRLTTFFEFTLEMIFLLDVIWGAFYQNFVHFITKLWVIWGDWNDIPGWVFCYLASGKFKKSELSVSMEWEGEECFMVQKAFTKSVFSFLNFNNSLKRMFPQRIMFTMMKWTFSSVITIFACSRTDSTKSLN